VLNWQGQIGVTRAACNDPAWLLRHHGLAGDAAVEIMNEVLANVVGEAVT
jgi:hypothetical protein